MFWYHRLSSQVRRILSIIMVALLLAGHMILTPAKVSAFDKTSMRIPWAFGTFYINGGNTYDCPWSHVGKDRYAIDFALPIGTRVSTVEAGTAHIGEQTAVDTYGKYVWIDHGGGWNTRYAHLSEQWVSEGQTVKKGQVIGLSGWTGLPSQAAHHLHFSLRSNATNFGDGDAEIPEPLGGYTGFGGFGACTGQVGGPYTAPAPGGWWMGPTPSDGSTITSGKIPLQFRAVDNNNTGLDRVEITASYDGGNFYYLKYRKDLGAAVSQADVYYELPMTTNKVKVGINVYSKNGGYQLSPNGTRTFCTPAYGACPKSGLAGNGNPGGNGGIGGGPLVDGVLLCTDANYSGTCKGFSTGIVNDLASFGLSENVTSIQIAGAYTVYLNDGINQSGQPGIFNQDVTDLTPHNWNNRAKSLKIERVNDTSCSVDSNTNGIILYRDVDFQTKGGCKLITASINDLGPSTFVGFNGLRFSGNYLYHYKATVYRDANYGITCGTYWLDQSDLRECAGAGVSVKVESYEAPPQAQNLAFIARRDVTGSGAVVDNSLSTEWIGGHGFRLGFVYDTPQEIKNVVVFDRAQSGSDNNQINKLQLVFSDGTVINDIDMISGGPRCAEVSFPAKTVSWVNVVPTDASGNNGLKEVQIWDTTGSVYSQNNCVNKLNRTPVTGSGPAPTISPNPQQPPVLDTFESFSNGVNNWWVNGNVGSVEENSTAYLRFSPPAESSAESSRNVNSAALAAYDAITLLINTHGVELLGNDASALYLDQGGSWKYVSLSNYVIQELDGWQNVTIPLSDFAGFNKAASFSRLGFRFWTPEASTIDVDEIMFIRSAAGNPTPTPSPTPMPTPSPTPPATGVELLTSPWHLVGNNGDAQDYQSIGPNILQGKSTVRITYNLHGLNALGGDASAIIFDQGGDWHYISLSGYGQNGLNGVQTVDIPLSGFAGLNLSQPVGDIHSRFWYGSSFTVDITSIVVR